MYRNQGVYYRTQAPTYVRKSGLPLQRAYTREKPIRWGVYEVLSSMLLIALSLIFVAGIAALVLHIVGFDSLAQLYGSIG